MRVDKSDFKQNKSSIFTQMSYLSFVIGSSAWLLVTILYNHPVPFSVTSYFLMITITLFIAYMRADLQFLWAGEFNDNELEDNLMK